MGQEVATTQLEGEAPNTKQIVKLHQNCLSKLSSNGVPKGPQIKFPKANSNNAFHGNNEFGINFKNWKLQNYLLILLHEVKRNSNNAFASGDIISRHKNLKKKGHMSSINPKP